jgi:DNA sulfur modification protein DndD
VEAQQAQQLLTLLEERDAWLTAQLPPDLGPTIQDLLAADRNERTPSPAKTVPLGLTPEQARELAATPDAVSSALASAKTLLKQAHALQEDLAQVESLLGRVPDNSRVSTHMADRDSARASFARLDGQLQILDEDIARYTRDMETLETRIAKVEARRIQVGVDSDDKRRIVEHADRVRATLAGLRTRLIERNIGRIEIATLDSFRRLMRKTGLVADLRIDPKTYNLQLTTASGDSLSPSRLSAGERQLLAVALLWGLARVAGNQLPTVIDTPLGRLDSVHRQHLVERYFPHASDQVLLLSTDEEIDAGLLPQLAGSISAAYLLEHDADQDRTAIRHGYWWSTENADVA